MEMDDATLNSLVTRATERATQNVAAIHRRRLITQSALVTFVVMCVIAIPAVALLNNGTEESDRHDVQRNCQAQADARPQSNARAFDQVAFLDLLEDVTAATAKKPGARAFFNSYLAHVNELAKEWRPFTGDELPLRITSFRQLSASIHPIPLLDCRTQVKE